PTPPYINWATAATNIQDAVDAAVAGDEVVVTNGIYAAGARSVGLCTMNRVAVEKALTLRSVNGPQFTTIDGSQTVRCVYLTNNAGLYGFTLTNGHDGVAWCEGFQYFGYGGGVYCASQSTVVSNCVITSNTVFGSGGHRGTGGGAYGGTL